MLRRARIMFHPLDPQRVEILEEGLDVLLGELVDRLAVLGGLLDDAVLDVSEVHHLGHAISLLEGDPAQQVLEEEGAEVTDVRYVVDGRTAGIHPTLARLEWTELFP